MTRCLFPALATCCRSPAITWPSWPARYFSFSAIPGLADRAPIKKWAALAALFVTGFYLILSGNQVATQRSFIMIAVVLLGVLCDRPALTMRTLTIAALVVLAFAPESIVHPSFQMSFAATLALIAGAKDCESWWPSSGQAL
jgi:competence protein ComEC